MLKIGVVTAIPTPYRDPFWNVVAAEADTTVHVYYSAATSDDRPWSRSWKVRYESEILACDNSVAAFLSAVFPYHDSLITTRLSAGRHDALIVGGYNTLTMIAAIRYALHYRVPYFLMSESHLHAPRPTWRRVLKQQLVSYVVRNAAGCFPTGTWARDYLLHYGANADRLWYMPNVPDIEWFGVRARQLAAGRNEWRERHNLGEGPIVLFLGRLVPFKRVDLLIEAFATASVPVSTRLVIVGDGVERTSLEAIASRMGIADRVIFTGFVDPVDVPYWYAAADLFVLPSIGETWSVAVIEALASGLPVITTDSVGAAVDAITDPATGTIVRSNDALALAAAISTRITNPISRSQVSDRWAVNHQKFRYTDIASRIVAAIRSIVDSGIPTTAY